MFRKVVGVPQPATFYPTVRKMNEQKQGEKNNALLMTDNKKETIKNCR